MCSSDLAVSQWEAGDTEPDMKSILLLKSKLTFSLDWLLYGEGPKGFGDDIQRTLTLTDEQLEFLNLVKVIKPAERENWVNLGKSLAKIENNNENKVETTDDHPVDSGNNNKKMSSGTALGYSHKNNNQPDAKRKIK